MRQETEAGKCIGDGDYLAWKDMEWNLHGGAVLETVDAEVGSSKRGAVKRFAKSGFASPLFSPPTVLNS